MNVSTLATGLAAKGPTGEAAKSGPWGLAIVLILCAVCYFLFKSMSKHMRKVREEFPVRDKKPESPAQQADSTPDDADQVRPGGSADGDPDTRGGPAQT
jgi:hypothetical protein